jgi:hypothetical protein
MKRRIGVIGLDWERGIPLALAMRDYGYHSVIAYHPHGMVWEPPPNTNPETVTLLDQWAIPTTSQIDTLAQYCDLIFMCQPVEPETWLQLATSPLRVRPLPTVITYPAAQTDLDVLADTYQPLDLGYSPIWDTHPNPLERLINPTEQIRVAGSPGVWRAVESAWRPIINTIPVRSHGLPTGALFINVARMASLDPHGPSEGIAKVLPLVTETLRPPDGDVDSPAPPETRGEAHSEG